MQGTLLILNKTAILLITGRIKISWHAEKWLNNATWSCYLKQRTQIYQTSKK